VAVLGIVLSVRMTGEARRRLWMALGPGLALVGIGVLLPPLALFFGGAGLGWMIAGQFVLRGRVRMEYQTAVKHMRKGEYAPAITAMDTLIEAEPKAAEHYRFRADLHRLNGDLDRAVADFKRVIRLEPDALHGYTGLAEIAVQQEDFEQAYTYARQAVKRDSGGWMAAYNLGMIEDRRRAAKSATKHLERAMTAGIPHSRYRLLAHLWLARSAYRQGRIDDARQQVAALRKQVGGLREWLTLLDDEQAVSLRQMLGADVALAEQLMDETTSLDVLND
ncbi:MAG: tetratricopeptide repeat protein, partial [Anaerolineae bacterium]|nr:tetratricopeptide repeat protein [Anaerolineae bacterium]